MIGLEPYVGIHRSGRPPRRTCYDPSVKSKLGMTKSISILLTAMLAATLPAVAGEVYQPVLQYDPQRDAAKDIDAAVGEAKRSGRHVLLEIGGEWCIWCHRLDDFLVKHKELGALLERNYVLVKVNFSPENKNEKALSRYSKVAGYPHFFVLDREGKFVHSQNTGELEKGKSYDAKIFKAFLTRWGPGGG